MVKSSNHHSPAHRWGQIIGGMLEDAVKPLLADFANQADLYLDSKGTRPSRKTVDVVWEDSRGNRHKLDYVLERGGTSDHTGAPVAFIEIAWRRYTKHSKNKAQEIEAAIQPLLTTHREAAPFFGVILAGEFTPPSLNQLMSVGCTVLYFAYSSVIAAFKEVGIDASTEENTPREILENKVRAWGQLAPQQRNSVAKKLLKLNETQVKQFLEELRIIATRQVENIRILPLHGILAEFSSAEEAMRFIEDYNTTPVVLPFAKYEITVSYSNGNRITAEFADKVSASQFLEGYRAPAVRLADAETNNQETTKANTVIELAFDDDDI